jgi:hypothetical protein
VILGLFVLFICTAVNLYEDAPTWGTEVFKARIANHGSPERRTAMFDEKRASLSPIRFYCWCGVVLVVAGAAGFTWQQVRLCHRRSAAAFPLAVRSYGDPGDDPPTPQS